MNTNLNSNPSHNGANTTTTEELIVQYLDGELVRKELETVLFDRLSQSEEARLLLREYLVVRGAIRVSREHAQFQLSDDLDERTRARIQQIMETMAADELLAPAAASAEPIANRGFAPDRGAVASTSMSRRFKRWQLRSSLAALSLLLAVGMVWLVSENTTDRQASSIQPSQSPAINSAPAKLAQNSGLTTSQELSSVPTSEAIANLTGGVKRAATHVRESAKTVLPSSSTIAQTHDSKADAPASSSETQDASDVMILHRYGKTIHATSKHEL